MSAQLARRANGRPAAAAYSLYQGRELPAADIWVFTVTGRGIRQIWSFAGPSPAAWFDFLCPAEHPWLQRARVRQVLRNPGKRLQDVAARLLGQGVSGRPTHQPEHEIPASFVPMARAGCRPPDSPFRRPIMTGS